MSEADKIKARIEFLLSRILSEKHNADIEIKFRRDENGDCNQTGDIREK